MQTSRILALGGFAAFAAMSVEARGAETLLEALRGLAPSSIVSERIVGGDPTSQNEWPWQNALYFRGARRPSILRLRRFADRAELGAHRGALLRRNPQAGGLDRRHQHRQDFGGWHS